MLARSESGRDWHGVSRVLPYIITKYYALKQHIANKVKCIFYLRVKGIPEEFVVADEFYVVIPKISR